MFVRDPFERAISAYYNKVATNLLLRGRKFTLNTYFKHLAEENEGNFHFVPQMSLCDPCKLNISYLGRTETILRDVDIIVNHKTSLHEKIDFSLENKNQTGWRIKETKYQPRELIYNQLDKQILKKFAWKYWIDFMAFGYNPHTFLQNF